MGTGARTANEELGTEVQSLQNAPKAGRDALGLVWIDCPYPVLVKGLEAVLADSARIHVGSSPPEDEAPDLIIVSPDETGDIVSEVEYLRNSAADTPILIFGLRVDLRVGKAAFQAGARGFIHVGMEPAQIVNALSLARAGEVVIPSELLEGLVVEETPSGADTLTSRQREILTLVADGLTNAQIAQRLYLSEFTIKQHLRHAYKVLGVKNRIEAANLFRGET